MENITLTREEVLAIVQEALILQHSADLTAREEALNEQQAALDAREKLDRALQLLRERGLPEEMAPALSQLPDEDMVSAADAWDILFRAAVRRQVEERLRGDAPMTGVMQDVNNLSDEDYYAALYPHLQ